MPESTRRVFLPLADQLPMAGHVRGKRSPVTCQLKCANQCLAGVCNTSSNRTFRDIVNAQLSRRSALGLGLAGVVSLSFLGNPHRASAAPLLRGATDDPLLPFTPIAPVHFEADEFTVPEGYSWHPLIRWGDALFADSPAFDALNQTAEAQAKQFGYNNDYTDIIRIDDTHALLFVNHEYTNENIMFPDEQLEGDLDRVRRVGLEAHGLSVVELVRPRIAAPWQVVVGGRRNRRFLSSTRYEFTGAAAGSDLLKTEDGPEGTHTTGTFGNCAGGTTPWGTVLSGEENFHSYFRAAGTSEQDQRYGLSDEATVRGWEAVDPRFDTRNAGQENAANHFGWIVEVDPSDPASTPRKHTALGRFKHEGASVRVDEQGRVAAYMGDDEVFDYLYKFVSSRRYVEGDRANNLELLAEGSLYVARFTGNSESEIDGTGSVPADGRFDGQGEWVALVENGESRVEGFTVEQVLVYTRLAADKVGATKMDRCEDVEPSPVSGKVYVACTNNSSRGLEGFAVADEANPRTENRDGHVIEITEQGGDLTATRFDWNLLLVAGDVSQGDAVYFSGFPADAVSPISCPDNFAFDSTGNLWISTDGAPDGIGYNDGLFKVTLEGEERGLVEQFLSVPREAETCGPVVHDDERHVYVSVQHPGEDGAFEDRHSRWPDFAPAGANGANGAFHGPRPSVVQVLPTVELEPGTPTPAPTSTETPAPTSTATPAPTSASPTPTGSSGNEGPGATRPGSTRPGDTGELAATGGGDGGAGLLAAGAAALMGAGAAFLARRSRTLRDDEDDAQ